MRITVTVPKTINTVNAYADRVDPALFEDAGEHRLDMVKRQIARAFGGFTAYDAAGGWVDDDGNLIQEPVTVVESYVTEDIPEAKDAVRNIARGVMVALCQDAAMYTLDNEAHFISRGE